MRHHIIIIGTNTMTRLCLIRSIGEVIDCDITVIHMVYEMPKKKYLPSDAYSKYVKECFFAYKFNAESLCNILLEHCSGKEEKPLILSVDDDSANLIDSSLDRLKDHFHCAHINHTQGQLARLMNKQVQKQLALEAGFHVARSWVLGQKDGHYIVPDEVTYPCYLKGLLSYHSMKMRQGCFKSREELLHALDDMSKQSFHPMLVEEYLDIEEELGVMGLADGERTEVPAIVELLESGRGPQKGVSALGSVRKEASGENIIGKVVSLARKSGLFGLFNVDLAICHGKVYFLELNLRFAAYGYAITKAGANLPALMVKRSYGEPQDGCDTQIGRDCRYINDFVALCDFVRGYRSWKDYKALRLKADVALMNEPTDERPFKQFKSKMWIDCLKERIKNKLDERKRKKTDNR